MQKLLLNVYCGHEPTLIDGGVTVPNSEGRPLQRWSFLLRKHGGAPSWLTNYPSLTIPNISLIFRNEF